MKRIILIFACIFLPLNGFGRERGFFPAPAATISERPGIDSAGVRAAARPPVGAVAFQLFPDEHAVAWNDQGGPAVAPRASGISPPAPKNTRPHLIELTAANWRPLTVSEKFEFFWRDLLHWSTHASLAFDSGLSFATEDRPYLGRGAKGYFSRYGLNAADEANFSFFNSFFFPTLFKQDPRYIPRDHSGTGARLAYAVTRVLVTRNDLGQSEVNASNMIGMFVSTSISTAMYSSYGEDIGIRGNFVSYGLNMGTEAAFDIFKEFWPDVARKMKLNIWLRNLVRASVRDFVRVR